jgi:hypothetical protein
MTKTMKRLILTLAAAAALAGCIKMDKTPPKDMPAYVRLYPGSTQMMNMNMGGMEADVFTTTAGADDVITFYRTQAATDGLSETAAPQSTTAAPGDKQLALADAATDRMLVVVAKPQQAGGTIVSLTWKVPAAKAPS